MERRQTAERQRRALVVFSVPSFASAGRIGGMGRTSGLGGISSLKTVVKHLEGCLDAIIGSSWNVVTAFDRLEAATQGVVWGGQAVWAKLVGLLSIVQERLEDLLAATKEATGAIVNQVGSVEVMHENVKCVCICSLYLSCVGF